MKTADRIIVALDVDSRAGALKLVRQLMPQAGYFKVGSQLFTACGPDLVREITGMGARVFLDLKFHDISTTVASAVLAAARLGVSMMNIHALGGMSMMQAASKTLADNFPPEQRPHLIAVTMLTSIAEVDAREMGFSLPIADQTARLALMAQRAGLDGVVASPLEIAEIRHTCGQNFLIVTPGIRLAHTSMDDQIRVATPQTALHSGANYLVVGRPVIEATDPLRAFQEVVCSADEPLTDTAVAV